MDTAELEVRIGTLEDVTADQEARIVAAEGKYTGWEMKITITITSQISYLLIPNKICSILTFQDCNWLT